MLNTKEFIIRSSEMHNNKYNYDKSEYTKSAAKILITCPNHGDFWQEAGSHMRGYGCIKCRNEATSKAYIKPLNTVLQQFEDVHGDTYDYSLVEYKNGHTDVIILCSLHGEFRQNPRHHLEGAGCPKCGIIASGKKHLKTQEQFLLDARIVHGDRFDYSKAVYINAITKLCIICPVHGEFWQVPNDHTRGHGCTLCKASKGEKLIYDWLQANKITFKTQFELITPEIARNTKVMLIDFFVKHQEKQYFIEYDGIQHFEYTPFFHNGGIIDFDKQVQRDKVLNEFCELHKEKVTLIRFDHTQEKEEILLVLEEVFNPIQSTLI